MQPDIAFDTVCRLASNAPSIFSVLYRDLSAALHLRLIDCQVGWDGWSGGGCSDPAGCFARVTVPEQMQLFIIRVGISLLEL